MSSAQPKSAEPSMEEILASIRRIISDDQAPKPAPPEPPVAAHIASEPVVARKPPPAEDDEDILDLPPRPVRKPEPHLINDVPVANDLSFEDMPPAAPPAPKGQNDMNALMAAADFEPTTTAPAVAQQQAERLVSASTDRMVSTAFSSLSNTILANNARTLDDLVQEMMRPMIKSWLDDNLPNVVERLVRAEIERVSRGGR
jgi:cell pole-organizing protein PopZ